MGLFDWFRSPLACPIDADTRAWVDGRWQWLEAEFGPDRPGRAAVVLPRPEFFPDPYHATWDDLGTLLRRVCGYMGVDPAGVDLDVHDDRGPTAGYLHFDGRWEGAAGLYSADGGRFRVSVDAAGLADPLATIATLAHELGHVHLLGHGRVSPDAPDHEPLTDLLTVYFGMGVITANAVVRESSWRDGQYSGWSIGRQGYLTMPVYGYALARFARARNEIAPPWVRELRPDVRAAFNQAVRFLAAEPAG